MLPAEPHMNTKNTPAFQWKQGCLCYKKAAGSSGKSRLFRRRFCIRVFFYFFFSFRTTAAVLAVVLPYNPEGRIDTNGAVGTTNEADEHDQGEVLRRVTTEEMKGATGKEYRRQRINTAVNTLGNTVVSQFFIRIGPPVGTRIFADTVEDNDSFVHGVADNGQDGRQEGSINFQMEK